MKRGDDLTGVWHGLYSYPAYREPVYFVATIIQSGRHLSGTTHEQDRGEDGAPLALFAAIEGTRGAGDVSFLKQYDGSGGWVHGVSYEGRIMGDGDEIEGIWSIPGDAHGRFMMMRSPGATESVARRAFAKV